MSNKIDHLQLQATPLKGEAQTITLAPQQQGNSTRGARSR